MPKKKRRVSIRRRAPRPKARAKRRKVFRGPRFCTLETTFTEDSERCVQAVSTYIDRKTNRRKTWSCWWCPNNEEFLRGPCERTMLETERGCPPIKVVRTKE